MNIAKIALSYKGRFIRKGARVPDDYERLADGIRRGWIEVTGDPAAAPPPIAALPPVVGDPLAEQLTTVGGEVIVPEKPPAYVEPLIDDLEYLNPMAKESLLEDDIISVSHLEHSDVESLSDLRGIGEKLAGRLLADYAVYVDNLGNVATTDTEYDSVSQEDDNVESETTAKAAGEDEGAEDDEA